MCFKSSFSIPIPLSVKRIFIVFMAIIDLESGEMTGVNAAHNFPLLKRADGEFEWFEHDSELFLAGMDFTTYEQFTNRLYQGDMIYLYTDGVTEATNIEEELFSDERLLAFRYIGGGRTISEIASNTPKSYWTDRI